MEKPVWIAVVVLMAAGCLLRIWWRTRNGDTPNLPVVRRSLRIWILSSPIAIALCLGAAVFPDNRICQVVMALTALKWALDCSLVVIDAGGAARLCDHFMQLVLRRRVVAAEKSDLRMIRFMALLGFVVAVNITILGVSRALGS